MRTELALALVVLTFAGEAAGGVGRGSSVAIGTDGLALISYNDYTNGVLKVAHCSDLLCTTATISTLAPGGDTTSLGIGGDGLGLIAYGTGETIVRAAHCLDLLCRSATTSGIFSGDGVHSFVSLRELVIGADGLGFVTSFSSLINPGAVALLTSAHCSNAACTTFTSSGIASAILTDGEGLAGGPVAVAADGRPWIGYGWHSFAQDWQLTLRRCLDVACATTSPAVVIGSGQTPLAMATGSDGLGIVASTGATSGLHLVHCLDATCGGGASSVLLDATGPIRDAALAVGSDGLPLVAYVSGEALKVVHCNDPGCSSSTVSLLDGSQVTDNGLAIGADGLGLISYHDAADGVLKVAHCQDVACTSATITVPSPEGPVAVADLSVQLNHFPEPVTGLQTLTYLIASANLGPGEAAGVSVALDLPAGVVFQAASGQGWSCVQTGSRVACSRAQGPPMMPSIVVQLTAPPTQQLLFATATISSSTPDPEPGNNTDTEAATVTAAPLAELAVAMSDGGAVVHPGQPFTWTITASNLGLAAVFGATVRDVFPATITGVTWTCAASGGATCAPGGTGNITAGVDLPVGASVAFTATGTLSPSTYVLSNTATITPPAGHYDPNLADNTATVSSQPEPTQAYTLTSCRLLDTRVTPPPLSANTTRTVTVTGTCAVPADARAVMVNATAVAPGDRGNLRLYPTGANVPLASSLNFAPGRTRANNAVVPLGEGGQISVQCDMPPGSTATTHFVLDVFGYFK